MRYCGEITRQLDARAASRAQQAASDSYEFCNRELNAIELLIERGQSRQKAESLVRCPIKLACNGQGCQYGVESTAAALALDWPRVK